MEFNIYRKTDFSQFHRSMESIPQFSGINSTDLWNQFHRPKELMPQTKRTNSIDPDNLFHSPMEPIPQTRRTNFHRPMESLLNEISEIFIVLLHLIVDFRFWPHQQQQCLHCCCYCLRFFLSLSTPYNQMVCIIFYSSSLPCHTNYLVHLHFGLI